ncbi:MAG: hypothetical protein HQM03_18570 [Magnetococcales bacterium]|nr:hypothetical protein [Magnetococcales bacterium]
MSHPSDSWFCGPGNYFWTSDVRLADLELGFCATRDELVVAIHNLAHSGADEYEIGGSAYRTHALVAPLSGRFSSSVRKIARREPARLSA